MRTRLIIMAVLCAVGSFNVSTAAAGNTVVVSGLVDGDTGASLGTPTAIFFFWNGRTDSTDGIGRASENRGFGAAVSTTSRWAIGSFSQDAVGTSVTSCGHSNSACIISSADGAIDGAMDLQSMDSGGFTLVIDDAFPSDLRVGFIAFGGDVAVTLGVFTPAGTAPVTQAVAHSLGSTPAAVLFASASINADPPGTTVDSNFILGAMSGASNEGVVYDSSNDNSGLMETYGYAISTECLVQPTTAPGVLTNRAEFSALDGTNFTINWLERGTARRVFWAAIGGAGVQAIVGNLLTQTDTTTDIAETIGFRPKGILFASAARAESTADTPTDQDLLSVGAAASTSQRACIAVRDEDVLTASQVTLASEFDEVYASITELSAIDGLMDLKSVNDTGFVCIMDDAELTQSFVWYLAIGSISAPSMASWIGFHEPVPRAIPSIALLMPSTVWVPQHEASEGAALDWYTSYPAWIRFTAGPSVGFFSLTPLAGLEFPFPTWLPQIRTQRGQSRMIPSGVVPSV